MEKLQIMPVDFKNPIPLTSPKAEISLQNFLPFTFNLFVILQLQNG